MILVCFAVKEEASPFRRLADGCPGVKSVISGMGRAAAEKTVLHEIEQTNVKAVLTCGFAGGLEPGLKTGDVLFETDPAFPLLHKLREAGAKPGRFHCSNEVLTTAAAKLSARGLTGADAVEMESGWIQELCKIRSVPCATVRVILDEASMDLPLDFNLVLGPDQKLKPGKLARAILQQPALLPRLMRLGKLSSQAATQLAAVLWKITAP